MTRRFLPLAAICLAAVALFGLTRAPGSPATPIEYAVLARSTTEGGSSANSWRYSSTAESYMGTDTDDLLRKLGATKQVKQSADCALVNTIANRGWELVTHSHTDTASFNEIRDGSASSPVRVTTEEWWFRRAR